MRYNYLEAIVFERRFENTKTVTQEYREISLLGQFYEVLFGRGFLKVLH
jgi:hypothetical protein